MFSNEQLQQYLQTSSSVNSQPLVIAEWNMNIAENISTIGNYRFRPNSAVDSDDFIYSNIANTFDINDCDNDVKFWCGATDADVVVDGGLDNDDQPIAFVQPNEKERLLYSLEECFKRFRPRSGINKLRYFDNNYTHFVNNDLANRPRYYMPSRNDGFKYWTSYRKEDGIERGIANYRAGTLNYIYDAAPFVVYKDVVPSNRIVVKMQTNVGDVDLGPFLNNGLEIDDPFYGDTNKTTPVIWKIQTLKGDIWSDAISFNQLSLRSDGSPIIGTDGYVEISYGMKIPEIYQGKLSVAGKYPFASLLPVSPAVNTAYIVQENDNELGAVYVWNGSEYESFIPEYGWFLASEDISEDTQLVTNFVNPEYFVDGVTSETKYKEFEYIRGIRVVVETMNKQNSTFDLLELSPRLACDITDRVSNFSFNKSASDLGVSGMPVGQLLASSGSLDVFDFDDSFNKNNTNSILSTFTSNNLQVKLFEAIYNFDGQVESYHVPLKTLYADGFPESKSNTRTFSLNLRDLFFYFETLNAPQLLVENASLSYAVSFLLDSIGFSNYTFRRVDGEDDPIIPYFFVKPETSIAQVLQDLAIATQTAMFFDEYNNFVMMSKNYMMPSVEERETDIELLGSLDQEKVGINENSSTNTNLSNIVELSSKNQEVFNDGKITYQEKYIAKTYGSLKQANYVNQDKDWIYKPTLLWEVSGTQPLRAIDDDQQSQSSYTLAAIPLNSDLSDQEPYVANNQLQNNVIDFGEGAYWVTRYNGYLYANGEIIKYDAVEYSVSGIGNVWISSLREYQNYFSKIKFGGKIYPTGRVRIYAEPLYEEVNGVTVMTNGAVRKHGRSQFGTTIAYHNAGLPQYWSDNSVNAPVQGVEMDSRYLFSTFEDTQLDGVYNQKAISFSTAVDIQDPGNITDMVFAESKWIAVGTDGIFRSSEDGETWISYIEEGIDDTFVFNSIAYGAGPEAINRWIAAGYVINEDNNTAAMAYSEDGENWSNLEVDLDSTGIQQIVFKNNTWVAVGKKGLIATSPDGETWTQQTAHLDYTIFGDNKPKTISVISQEADIRIDAIKSGTPGTIVDKNHTLKTNDKIILTGSGTLPGELNKVDEYYVEYVNKDSFRLKETLEGTAINFGSNGSGTNTYKKLAVTLTAKNHGLSNGDAIRIVTSGTLPAGLAEDTVYYVRVINKDSFHLSETSGGELVEYTSAQSGQSHKIERFIYSKINSVDFGDSTWVVGGSNGVFATSSDSETWTAYATGMKNANILNVMYEESKWLLAGSSGKMQISTNLNTWSAVNTKLKKDISAIAYGGGKWVVAGTDGKISVSDNLSSWSVKDPKFNYKTINKLEYSEYWLAVGDGLKISKSSDDALTWSDKSQENIGELRFTTSIPHGFTPFDTIQFNTDGHISDNPETAVTIAVGNPAVFTSNNHKLNTNDKIMFSTSGSLPDGLSVDTVYYVVKIDKNTFNVALVLDGDPIEATGSHTGSHTFVLNPLNTQTVYYVTPKNITEYSFTVAETRSDARNGVTFKGKGYQDGDHTVELYTIPETLIVSSIEEYEVTVSGTSYTSVRVGLAEASQLGVGDRIFFGVRDSDLQYIDDSISYGLTRYAPFYIHTINSEYLLVSETYGGNPIRSNGNEFTLEAGNEIVIIKNITEEIINRTILSPQSIGLSVGNLLEVISGDGELVAPTRVSAIRSKTEIKKEVTISVDNPAVISCNSHGLFDLDIITFTTTGTLPHGIDSGIKYLVNKIDNNSFTLLDYNDLTDIETKEGINPDAEVTVIDEINDIETDIEYRTQSGSHYFVKSFNDINKIVINRAIGTELPQYSISEEEVVIDAENNETDTVTYYSNISYENSIVAIEELQITSDGKAGISSVNTTLARSSSRNGIIKNFFAKTSFSETDVNKFLSTQSGTVQSSALVFNGPSFEFGEDVTTKKPIDFISYVHKPLENRFSHFGTRMRIIGRISQEESEQILYDSLNYFLDPEASLDEQFSIYGGSAGLSVMINPETNIGYHFELIALSQSNVAEYADDVGLFNVVFYKTVRKIANEGEAEITDESKAIPIKLWQGIANIVADDGTFVGQSRMANEANPSVYDVAVEYENIDENTRRFYLLINNNVVGVVDDDSPLPIYNNMALFVRGGTRAMFENVYAIANNYSQNTVFELDAPVNSVFGTESIDVSESFKKYALSGGIQSTYLSGIGTNDVPKYNIYFEEFGTIMRECSYFNVKYDKAYPALYAKIADTFNKMKGYTVSGFVPSAYGAEFLVFNNTDTALNLDETTGNYLRILGVSFTQSSDKELTVDDYFERISNFADPDITEDGTIVSPIKAKQDFLDIKNSRLTYGRKEFNISSPYIQNQDEANDMMAWMISKIMKPRKSVGIKMFAMPTLQLGDIVSIDYNSNDGIEQISVDDSRFVVYNIEYKRDTSGPSMNVYLSEVI